MSSRAVGSRVYTRTTALSAWRRDGPQRIHISHSDWNIDCSVPMERTVGCWITACHEPRHQGELVGYIGSCIDITELRQAREVLERAHDELGHLVAVRTAELARANEELRAQIARRDELQEELARARRLESLALLASGVAHEFSNLLTVIYWRSQLIRDRVSDDPALSRGAEDIERAVQRATALTEQLLAFGQQQILDIHRIDLNRLLVDLSSPIAGGARVGDRP